VKLVLSGNVPEGVC